MFNHKRIQTYYSVLGAYSYDKDLFSNFSLHEDIAIDKESLIDYIIYENADLPLHVVNLDLLKVKIGLWCKKNKENWLRIYEALYQKYNPLHNFDRYEEISTLSKDNGQTKTESVANSEITENEALEHEGEKTDTFNKTDTTNYGKTDTRTDNLSEVTNYGKTDTRTDNLQESKAIENNETQTHTGTDTTTHENTAFNAGVSLTARDTLTRNLADAIDQDETQVTQNTGTQSTQTGGSDSVTNTGTQGTVSGGSDVLKQTGTIKTDDTYTDGREKTEIGEIAGNVTEDRTNTNNSSHEGHLWGNIGITTSQKMLADEVAVRCNNNFYDILSNQFKLEFCIMIY